MNDAWNLGIADPVDYCSVKLHTGIDRFWKILGDQILFGLSSIEIFKKLFFR